MFKNIEWLSEDIQLNTEGYYNTIKAGSIAWYVIKVLQVLLLFVFAVTPYLVALLLADALGC